MKVILGFLLIYILSLSAKAEDTESLVLPFGHDLSMTSYILKPDHCTVGLQVLGCGFNNRLIVATIPWLLTDYNMYNIVLRKGVGEETKDEQKAIQLGYFKTYPSNFLHLNPYQMEAVWGHYIYTLFFASQNATHFNVSGMYYLDDRFPWSLRRPWTERNPFQLNLSALSELHLTGGWFINAEIGVLGVIQKYPHIHLGLSFEYRLNRWLFHGGFSQTGSIEAYAVPFNRFDYQNFLINFSNDGFRGPYSELAVEYDFSVHPEFSIQYFF